MKVRLTQIGNSMSFQIPQAAMEHCVNLLIFQCEVIN